MVTAITFINDKIISAVILLSVCVIMNYCNEVTNNNNNKSGNGRRENTTTNTLFHKISSVCSTTVIQ